MQLRRMALGVLATDDQRIFVACTVATCWVYDPADAFAVTVEFTTARGRQWWTFGRDLLADGLEGPAGCGDVRVWVDAEKPGRFWLELSSPSGLARLAFNTEEVAGFLAATYDVVPAEWESAYIDWPAELAALTEGGGR